ncbi:F0F1 ATP synthase subunit delta [Sphingomonas sp. CJ99]
MDHSGGLQAGLNGRYAIALFDLAREAKAIESVEVSLATIKAALAESDDLAALTTSPLIARAASMAAIDAVARELAIDPITTKFLGVLAQNGRLAALPAIIRAFGQLAASHRGEVTAEVTSAHPLTDDQVTELKQQLRTRMGRDVAVDLSVDPALLGGLVVRIGSQMIDSSIRTRLNSLANAMKG